MLSCERDPEDDSKVEVREFIRQEYYDDARQLYYDEFSPKPGHANFNVAEFDEDAISDILRLIQVVYDAGIPERDTVFAEYNIHKYCVSSFNYLTVSVDPTNNAIAKWVENKTITGDVSLDKFISHYDFDQISKSYSYPSFSWVNVKFKKAWNTIKMADDLQEIDGINKVERNQGCVGDGDDITMMRDEHHAILTFSIGRGDCPAGCTYRRHWEFKVKGNMATFLRSY